MANYVFRTDHSHQWILPQNRFQSPVITSTSQKPDANTASFLCPENSRTLGWQACTKAEKSGNCNFYPLMHNLSVENLKDDRPIRIYSYFYGSYQSMVYLHGKKIIYYGIFHRSTSNEPSLLNLFFLVFFPATKSVFRDLKKKKNKKCVDQKS